MPRWAAPDCGRASAAPGVYTAREKAKAVISNGRGVTPGPPGFPPPVATRTRTPASPAGTRAADSPRYPKRAGSSQFGCRLGVAARRLNQSRPYAVIRCIRHWVRLRLSRARAVAGGRERGWSCQGSIAGPMPRTSPRTRHGRKARRPQGGALSSPTPPPAGSARWRTGSQATRCSRGRRLTRAPDARRAHLGSLFNATVMRRNAFQGTLRGGSPVLQLARSFGRHLRFPSALFLLSKQLRPVGLTHNNVR
jgi:hypothetical protein